jgi:hypothetical protein
MCASRKLEYTEAGGERRARELQGTTRPGAIRFAVWYVKVRMVRPFAVALLLLAATVANSQPRRETPVAEMR